MCGMDETRDWELKLKEWFVRSERRHNGSILCKLKREYDVFKFSKSPSGCK